MSTAAVDGLLVRPERPDDAARVQEVRRRAALAVDLAPSHDLEVAPASPVSRPVSSLVAERDGVVVGHLPVGRARWGGSLEVLAVGPCAVAPEEPADPAGLLVAAALDEARRLGLPAVLAGAHPSGRDARARALLADLPPVVANPRRTRL